MSKYIRKPEAVLAVQKKYEKFNLKDNPFPYDPIVVPDAEDIRKNGTIYNEQIKSDEFNNFKSKLLDQDLNSNNIRLAYLIDSAYTGRGNGKSAFLVHMQKIINEDYGEKLSNGKNKVFAVYVRPEPGENISRFWQLSEKIIRQMAKGNIFKDCMITLRYLGLSKMRHTKVLKNLKKDEDFEKLLDDKWLVENKVNVANLRSKMDELLTTAGISYELIRFILISPYKTSDSIVNYACNRPDSWKKKNISNFLFDELVRFFIMMNYNGAYILLDEFEKIVDIQKVLEKDELASEIRQFFLEGNQQGPILGFFMLIMAMHPGVPRLIIESWEKSGLNARAPLPTKGEDGPHVVFFNNLQKENIRVLIKEYLDNFRLNKLSENDIAPFEEESIIKIAELANSNAAKTLRFANIALNELVKSDSDLVSVTFLNRLVARKKQFPQEDITSPDFLKRDNSPIEDSLSSIKWSTEKN